MTKGDGHDLPSDSPRAHPPRAVRVPIRVRVEYQQVDDFLADYACNLSLGGMFIQTERPLPAGTRFRLRLLLPEPHEPIETYAEVRWVADTVDGERGMGVRFDTLSRTARQQVERLLSATA